MGERKAKPQRMWGITYINTPEVMPDTIRRTREEAQKACCDNRYQFRPGNEWRHEWKAWREQGCRAVRVRIVPEEPQP